MNRHCATIPAVEEPPSRPVWSVMIPTFNCCQFLRTTLGSVLQQDVGVQAMQIEVVDDYSTDDDVQRIVDEVARGRVTVFRQRQNVGHVRNFATCLRRARGRLVHLLHGDDYVAPGFYETLESAFRQEPSAGAAFCRAIYVDEAGVHVGMTDVEQQAPGLLDNAAQTLAAEQRIMTPSVVVRRAVYEELGGFDERLLCAEDWEMWVRIASRYPIWYEPQPLAYYRMHSASNTGRNERSGSNVRYTHLAIELFSHHLPPGTCRAVVGRAKQSYACAALRSAFQLARCGDLAGAAEVARQGLRLSRSPRVLCRAVAAECRRLLV